ncbi:hypothetical protein CDV55_101331 [Aspergillus turcosus]|nr:hypothetical protein CDV55_101331 [Aspergillus turcosus]
MLFTSKLPLPPRPASDVFDYIFHTARSEYPGHKVLYRVYGTDERLTLSEIEEKSRRLARVLSEKYKIRPNDVVSIFATDRIQYPLAYYACLAAGATVALIPVQTVTTKEDVAQYLRQYGTSLLFTDSDMLHMAEAAVKEVSGRSRDIPLVTLDKGSHIWPSLDALLSTASTCLEPVFQLNTPDDASHHIAFLNRTSGSTGDMKCVRISHAHFIATMKGTRATTPPDTNPDEDVWLSTISLGFLINAKINMGLNILLGVPVVFMRSELDTSDLRIIQCARISFLFITPPLAAQIARANMDDVDTSSVKWLLTAGAPMHDNLRQAVSRKFGGVPLTLELGTTETMLVAIQTEDWTRKPGSTGTLVSGLEAKVIDPLTGSELGPLDAGEILVRNCLAVYKGYKDNEIANRAFDSEGWFHTGDYGYLDEDCNVYIVDRIKELIKTGGGYGSHVSTTELETVLFTHPAVESVVVIGVRDEGTQLDRPTAFVVLKSCECPKQLSDEIQSFADQRLTGLRSLTGGVHCIPEIPKKGFKIDRNALRNMLSTGLPKAFIHGGDSKN